MSSLQNRLIAGFIAGLIGGFLFDVAVGTLFNVVAHLIISGVLGLLFGWLIGPNLHTGGSSVVWGEAYGMLWWLLGYLTLIPIVLGEGLYWTRRDIQALFPLLLGQVIAYGATLGLSYYLLIKLINRLTSRDEVNGPRAAILASRLQRVLIGSLGGLFGAWIFLLGIERADFFPLVAGLIGSESLAVGQTVHYLIGLIIGLGFGLLFHRDIHGTGSSVVWGMTYGISWWMLGPLTLRPLIAGTSIDWSLTAAEAAFTPLISHILYGALVGLFYALANKFWNTLFVDSDPLNRTRESVGAQGVRALLMGQAAGVVGGLLFTIVMVGINALPRVAGLVGGNSLFVGFLVHLLIAITVGSSYGLLFQNEAYGYGSGLGWGLLYGLLWWLLGPNTLFFVILRQPVDWSLGAAVGNYPALVGHMLYGLGVGLFFQYLVRRYHTPVLPQAGQPHRHHTTGTPAAALWSVTLLIGVLLPLLLRATTTSTSYP